MPYSPYSPFSMYDVEGGEETDTETVYRIQDITKLTITRVNEEPINKTTLIDQNPIMAILDILNCLYINGRTYDLTIADMIFTSTGELNLKILRNDTGLWIILVSEKPGVRLNISLCKLSVDEDDSITCTDDPIVDDPVDSVNIYTKEGGDYRGLRILIKFLEKYETIKHSEAVQFNIDEVDMMDKMDRSMKPSGYYLMHILNKNQSRVVAASEPQPEDEGGMLLHRCNLRNSHFCDAFIQLFVIINDTDPQLEHTIRAIYQYSKGTMDVGILYLIAYICEALVDGDFKYLIEGYGVDQVNVYV